jgi:hypothetical protein
VVKARFKKKMLSFHGISKVKIQQRSILVVSLKEKLLIHAFSTSNGSSIILKRNKKTKKEQEIYIPSVTSQRVLNYLIQSSDIIKAWKILTSYKRFVITKHNRIFEHKDIMVKQDSFMLRHVVQLLPLDEYMVLKNRPEKSMLSSIENVTFKDIHWRYTQCRQEFVIPIVSTNEVEQEERVKEETLFQRISSFFQRFSMSSITSTTTTSSSSSSSRTNTDSSPAASSIVQKKKHLWSIL